MPGLILRGAVMGIAELLPGISGGTVALLSGIYERLISALSELSDALLSVFRRFDGALDELFKPLRFLLPLGFGMLVGFGVAVAVISQLLNTQPLLVFGFIFGVMVGASYYTLVFANLRNATIFLPLGLILSASLNFIPTQHEGASLLLIFAGGVLAFGAWIVPGISGSFVLLVLGVWTTMIGALSSFEWMRILVFLAGLLVGWMIFIRPLRVVLENHRKELMALFSGLIIGSLWRVWPWRMDSWPVVPWKFDGDPSTLLVCVTMCVGLSVVLLSTYRYVQKDL